ncbi:MAG: internalin [Flavobacterium sp. BFFFF1]|uniref:T9SS type A sorting domain-containing protein n=1 Tax=Flavobacterium sp. BFFFF1 TaxID=2015557 RepID=UPI000BD9C731|nr:T9SS type A sorting domain-containing protein [Flavobacterium sp. BFFFF1]OYU79360.1 MAG: internalin [Flavobacterium sp. BFFFF1]
MKITILFLVIAFSTIANAQIVNIPDANFKARLLQATQYNTIASTSMPNDNGYVPSYNKIDINNDGEIQVSEALLIKWLKVSTANITDVTGINEFINLKCFICTSNQITDLDVSGLMNLRFLSCQINDLNSLNIKNNNPDSWLTLDFFSNDQIDYICADEDDLTYVKNRALFYAYNYCNVNSYCSFTPGGIFYAIQGNNKFDNNTDGCDSNDLILPNLKYNITNGSVIGSTISNKSGNYFIPLQSGTYTITPQLENPTYFNVNPIDVQVTFPGTTSPHIQNFCITPNGNMQDLEVVMAPTGPARPGFNATYTLMYKNKGNQVANGNVTLTFRDDILDLVSSSVSTTSQQINELTWAYSNLLPFETRTINLVFNVNSPQETPQVNIGTKLGYTAFIGPLENDANSLDNYAQLNQIVVGSYDPNDKTCLEGTTIDPANIGKYVNYVVRFENTGTYPAQNVVVVDNIDTAKFDINTLIPLHSSHNFVTRISNTNKVEFIFEGINLPFDDANNDGYVIFKIKTNPNLVVGNTFSNSAKIYFDYNFPIATNNYTTTIQSTLGLQENEINNEITVYPNPVRDLLYFKTEYSVLKVQIFDIIGRIISSNSVSGNKIDLSSLQSGNYVLKVYTEKGIMNTNIIKE